FWKSRPGLLRRIVPSSCCSASSALADTRSERWRSPGPQLQAHVYALGSTLSIPGPWKPHPVVDPKINGNPITATSRAHTLMVAMDPDGKWRERARRRTRFVADEKPFTIEAPRRRGANVDNHLRRTMDWNLTMNCSSLARGMAGSLVPTR